jgi:hypothetical protein
MGQCRCRAAKVMHTNWLLSPNSAAATKANAVPDDAHHRAQSTTGKLRSSHTPAS